MGRHTYVVTLAGVISACCAAASLGQAPVQVPAQPAQPPMTGGHGPGPGAGSIIRPGANGGFERWREMRPEERQRFRSNAERWLQMPAEEQRMLREREEMRRERARREAEAALRQSGLELEAERRAQYEKRYLQERRRIEQSLREELEQKRQRELAPVVERLKKEFTEKGNSSTASPNTSATATSKPSKQ